MSRADWSMNTMRIQGFVIGENKQREFEKMDVDMEVSRTEFRKLLASPYRVRVKGLRHLFVVKIGAMDLEGDRQVKVDWQEPVNSCDAESIIELLH